jgi:diguanylate cyclase (GGDEF)-like protein
MQQHSRRSSDHGRLHRELLQLTNRAARAWDPIAGGQLMLLTNGVVIVLTLPMLDARHWRPNVVLVALTTAVAWSVSILIPWARLPRKATLAFPLFAWFAMALFGIHTQGIAGAWGGLFTLWFAYLGLTHRSGTSVLLMPAAIGSYVAVWDGWSSPLLARLLIATVIWLLLAEVLAALIERQSVLTEEMRQLAHVDTLTSLANRRDLDLRLAEAGPGDSVILVDLDHFKHLNDSLGHAAGDAVLGEFGLVIRATLRQNDYAARYGGEEFALVLPDTNEADAAVTLNRLRQSWAILRPEITFSAGVCRWRPDRTATETLRAADEALYLAKEAGRNRDHGTDGALSSAPLRQIA